VILHFLEITNTRLRLFQARSSDLRKKKLDEIGSGGNIRLSSKNEDGRRGWMARHNREGQGADQQGFRYSINYQPDWLRLVKVTRTLDSGRQSTKTLFRNPLPRPEASPGERVRTRILSRDQGLEVELCVTDPRQIVRRVQVTCTVPTPEGGEEEVVLTLQDGLALDPDEA